MKLRYKIAIRIMNMIDTTPSERYKYRRVCEATADMIIEDIQPLIDALVPEFSYFDDLNEHKMVHPIENAECNGWNNCRKEILGNIKKMRG